MPELKLKSGREKSLHFRHPWIFSGALELGSVGASGSLVGSDNSHKILEDGTVVDIVAADGRFLARGYYNSKSNIAVRVLTFEQEEIDLEFFKKKMQAAWDYRKEYVGDDTMAYRVVFAESDGLPGLIVDKYGEYLVVQIHTLGMEHLKALVVDSLIAIFKPKAIYERSDVNVRKQDGLTTMPQGLLYGKLPKVAKGRIEIEEHGVKFLVDVVEGQKTGFFLDQRENRLALQKYVSGKKVLNLFAYTGGFSCYALAAGAESVVSVDISVEASKLCDENVALNRFKKGTHKSVTSDVFAYLDKAFDKKEVFDVVIVDPPAFVKSQKDLETALKAYTLLNAQALKVLRKGGLLVSSSCSSYVTPELFQKALFQAAMRGGNDLIILEQRSQPFDHPLRLFFPEGQYLKFFVLRKG